MFWLSLLIWLSASQTCVLQSSTQCDGTSASGRGTTLSIASATAENCAQACLDDGTPGCCDFDGSTCIVYPDAITDPNPVDSSRFAAVCVESFTPTSAPFQCIDHDDQVSGIPFAFTCEDATYWIAIENGFSQDMCDMPSVQWLQGQTFREVCCQECRELDELWVDDDSYNVLTGQCVDSESDETTSYVEQRFTAFRECAQLCSQTQSCQGFTFNSARPVFCQIHIRSEQHQPFIDQGWSSVVINDGNFVDTSDGSFLNGDCMLRITQAPSNFPSTTPSVKPTNLPSSDPSYGPSVTPTTSPSFSPSVLPSSSPSFSPSVDPTVNPSDSPETSRPSVTPTTSPSSGPSVIPSANPSHGPTVMPTDVPSVDPTANPSAGPSVTPTDLPSYGPSVDPTNSPSCSPSLNPSFSPSVDPTAFPSTGPTVDPTRNPTSDSPSRSPTVGPSNSPSVKPSDIPSVDPTVPPSVSPSVEPSHNPSTVPTVDPSNVPSTSPTSDSPSTSPSKNPTFTQPSHSPSTSPTTNYPTTGPIVSPSNPPSNDPTTDTPTITPSDAPSVDPSKNPTGPPSAFPTSAPTKQPRVEPSTGPSTVPTTDTPTLTPTDPPSTAEPSFNPSVIPSYDPSVSPTVSPSAHPTTVLPSQSPSVEPSFGPSTSPTTDEPTISPTFNPSVDPSVAPSYGPSVTPSNLPSKSPTVCPSCGPSVDPTANPSYGPTVQPTHYPSYTPTITNPCSPANMNILGSNFIFLHMDYSSFADDFLELGIAFPGRYQPKKAEFSDSSSDVGKFSGDFSANEYWKNPVLHQAEECLYVMKFEMAWGQVLRDSVMGLDLHYEGEQQYFMNTLKVTFLENATSHFFEIDITREIYVEIPWLILLKDQVDLNINFTVSIPTFGPTTSPSVIPSEDPSLSPTSENPTVSPSFNPTTGDPSTSPSVSPSRKPSIDPTNEPSVDPTFNPTGHPSIDPTAEPTFEPTIDPTNHPTGDPTTSFPSVDPTPFPSGGPTTTPSDNPSLTPTVRPSDNPSTQPTVSPSDDPSVNPSFAPSTNPTVGPSTSPSVDPSLSPSRTPSTSPSKHPSTSPSKSPTVDPSTSPSTSPSKSPTPREEINFDIGVEAWQTINLGQYISAADHDGETLQVLTVTHVGSFSFSGSVVTVGQTLAPSDLPNVGFSPEVVASNTTTQFVIQGDHKRYTFNILVIRPSPCVGSWSDYSQCTVSCDTGTQFRTYAVASPADQFGEECEAEDNDVETQTCQTVECPVLDKVVLEFAVAEPSLTGTTKVSFNFSTLVQWPWKTLEPGLSTDPDCWDIQDDNTALSSRIIDNSEKFWIIDDCTPDYVYGQFDGFCVGDSNSAATVPAIYIRGVSQICNDPLNIEDCKVHPICEEICTALDTCEGFDIFYDRPDQNRWVCEVLGMNITSIDRNWVEANYPVTPWFFFRFDIFDPESPVGGNIPAAANVDCYLRDTPVYEGDCEQKWHGEYVVDGVCDVNGEYTTTICVQHQVTQTVDKVDVTLSASLDTACAEVVDTLSLEGTITTFADSEFSFTTNIYHVGDMVYTRSTVASRIELTGISLVGLVADQGFNPPNLFPNLVDQSVRSLSVLNQATNHYETIFDFWFTLDNVEGTGDGIATTLAATFEATYVGGNRRMLALDTSTHAPIGASQTLIIYPAPCQDPVAAYGQYLTETCGEDIRILKCDEDGKWTTIVNDWKILICPSSSGVYISEETPDGLDSPDTRTIYVNSKSKDDSLILTGIIVAVVAFLVALAVYLYVEYYGNCLNKDKKTIVSFEGEPSKRTMGATAAGFTPTGFYEPEIRQATPAYYNDNLNYQDQDDNVSEISVSSSIKEEHAMHMVFDHIFDEGHNKL